MTATRLRNSMTKRHKMSDGLLPLSEKLFLGNRVNIQVARKIHDFSKTQAVVFSPINLQRGILADGVKKCTAQPHGEQKHAFEFHFNRHFF
jgi:hypothetical protein